MPKQAADPIAHISVPAFARVGDQVLVDISASHDPGGFIRSAQVNFDDGTTSALSAKKLRPISHVWWEPSTFEIVLTVVDNSGRSSKATAELTIFPALVEEPPPAPVDAVWDWTLWTPNDDFGPCQPNGYQVGTETRTPVLVSEAQNGGNAAAPPAETREARRKCDYLPPPPPPTDARAWFKELAQRPDCVAAYALGSQADVDALTPRQKPFDPMLQKKRPLVYDPVHDAMMGTIWPPLSTDTQQVLYKFPYTPGDDLLIAFDQMLSPEHLFRGAGDIHRHKAQQVRSPQGGVLWTIRNFYAYAAEYNKQHGTSYVAERTVNSNSARRMLPPTTNPNEIISPRTERFFVHPMVWSRLYIVHRYVCPLKDYTGEVLPPWSEDGVLTDQRTKWPDSHVMRLSYYCADEDRDPILILKPTPVLVTYPDGIGGVISMWDTGQDNAPTDERFKYFWERNFVAIRNPPEDLAPLLRRPVK